MSDAASDLITNLYGLPHVEDVVLHWDPGLTVKVHLGEMNWAVRAQVIGFVRGYCRRVMIENPGTRIGAFVRFTIPEPTEFTEATVTA